MVTTYSQLLGMGASFVGSPIKQHIVNGISVKLIDIMSTEVEIFDTEIPENHNNEIELPFVVFKLGNLAIRNFMSEDETDFVTTLSVSLMTDADEGPQATREIEEVLYRGLHKVFLTCDGYAKVKIRCINRGDCLPLRDRLFMTTDIFEIYGSEEI